MARWWHRAAVIGARDPTSLTEYSTTDDAPALSSRQHRTGNAVRAHLTLLPCQSTAG
jgi:hypothetical protein